MKQPDGLTVPQFFDMNGPDQKGNFEKLAKHFRATRGRAPNSVKVRHCRLPFLSMWLCFACDRGLRTSDFDNFDLPRWQSAAKRYRRLVGVRGHCAIVAQRVRELEMVPG